MVKYNLSFSKRLMKKMDESGVTQADLCRITGLASSMISHYCTGQRVPSVQVAAKIAKALNTSIDYLASGNLYGKDQSLSDPLYVAENAKDYNPGKKQTQKDENDALLKMYNALNASGKEKVRSYIEDLLFIKKYK